ncbi:MAG TPA: ABC transporter permease [Chloroflexota bacterium]|nr:ABC transporter permease [Chloroflexota bacterium]
MKRGAAVASSAYAPEQSTGRSMATAARLAQRYGLSFGAPALVLLVVLALWQFVLHQQQLPAPSAIFAALGANLALILSDVQVTFWQEALRGYVVGCGLGFLAGVLCSRFDWLRRGLVPYAVLSNSIPIIAFSPIMVFWFGFEWPSKAAVVLVLCFFPMLINTTTGLISYPSLSRDLLTSYAANGLTVFTKLQLPAALPMIFNGLKICSTLSVIGATVAEYFSSLGKGLGSQIQDGASAAAWDLVWACVFAACLVGIIFYAILLLLERLFTFWHVSYRSAS